MASAVRVVVHGARADTVSAELFLLGATAVSERDDGDRVVLIAGFDDRAAAADAITALQPDLDASLEPDDERTWIVDQRVGLSPTTVAGWTVRAPWHDPTREGVREIVIDPGAAFGHGGHPTTALLLGFLEAVVRPGSRVIDVGAGTGVLAVAAARLGAQVTAVEIDSESAEIARANVARNGLEQEVRVVGGDAAGIEAGDAEVAIANLTIADHRHVAGALSAIPTVLVSGVIGEQVDEVRRLYPGRISDRRDADGWVGLRIDRPSAASEPVVG